MVQNKQKSNKINITAFVTCFMLIVVFVFGCVQYAFASSLVTISDMLSKFDGDKSCYIAYTANFSGGYTGLCAFASNYTGKMCAFRTNNSTGIISNNSFYITWFDDNFKKSNVGQMNVNSSGYALYSMSGATLEYIDFQSTMITFSTQEDAVKYIQTGEINNPIYQPKENVEYDSDIEVPLNLDIRLNGNSDFIPNVKISCNQTEQVEDRYLEIQYSIGYKATWKLLGGIGLSLKSKTSPTLYGSIEQLEDNFDNGGTSFETILSLTKLSHSTAPDKEAFSKYEPTPKTYWTLKEIKNDNSEMKIWCRNRVGNKASKWVMVSGNGYKVNFDVVDSDENGNPTDLKDDVANSNTGYGSDYWNNRDTTPQEDYSIANVKTNLKDLKNNYTSLANFYKELFSFLPAEIWILLISFVSIVVIIAIVVFVRG